MSFSAITVTIKEPVKAGTGTGGKSVTLTTVSSGVSCRKHLPGRRNQFRTEEAGGQASGPGVGTQTDMIFFFESASVSALPEIKRSYVIEEADGTQWEVQVPPRGPYDLPGGKKQLQVDTQRVR